MAERFGWRVILLRANPRVVQRPSLGYRRPGRDSSASWQLGLHGREICRAGLRPARWPDGHGRRTGPLSPRSPRAAGRRIVTYRRVSDLPRYLYWHGQKVGEIVRLRRVSVCPPSVIRRPAARIAGWWTRAALPGASAGVGGDLRSSAPGAAPMGEPDPERLALALKQPGARRRSNGVKFQCPACRAEGHDRHRDNAIMFTDGRFGCAYDSAHGPAIAEALGLRRTSYRFAALRVVGYPGHFQWPLTGTRPQGPYDVQRHLKMKRTSFA